MQKLGSMLFVDQGKTFQIWEPTLLKNLGQTLEKSNINRASLKWEKQFNNKGENDINFKTPDIKELKPRILVLGVGGAGGNAINGMIEPAYKALSLLQLIQMLKI